MEPVFADYSQYIEFIFKNVSSYGTKIIVAFLIFMIGKRIARWLTDLLVKGLHKNQVDVELVGFFDSLFYWGLLAIVLIAALAHLGVQTASFVAIIGAAGLAVGLALQGSLSNFAAGVLIILLRPFRVGEVVDIAGESGTVRSIKIFTTELRTGDNKCVIIPNSRVLDSNIVNHSSTGTRRVDLLFSVGYEQDTDRVRQVLADIVDRDERVLADPAPQISVSQLADSSVNFVVRPWVKSADYWRVYTDLTEQVKKRFDEEGISIPFPQNTVRIIKESD